MLLAKTKLMATISKLSGELEKANGELVKERAKNSSQQDVFSRKIEDMSKKKDEEISEYPTQVRTLHAELLRREGYCSPENLPDQGNFAKKTTDPNPKGGICCLDSRVGVTGYDPSHSQCSSADGGTSLRSC